jgi:hypothetical protein
VNRTEGTDPFGKWFADLCTSSGLTQDSHHGRVDYRNGAKIVVNLEDDGAVTLKLPIDEQQAMLHAPPEIVRLPSGWATHGWTTIRLDALERDHVRELLALAIATVAGPR